MSIEPFRRYLLAVTFLMLCGAPASAQTEWNKGAILEPVVPGGPKSLSTVNLCGICAVIKQDKETKKIVIVQVLPDQAAEKAGLREKDVILQVDDTKIDGLDALQVATLLRGNPGTKVSVTVMNDSFTTPKRLIVMREPVRLKEVFSPQQEWAIKVATEHLKKTLPEIDVSTLTPSLRCFENSVAHRGSVWAVEFPVQAKERFTGRTVGVRPITHTVWVRPDGTVDGSISHSP